MSGIHKFNCLLIASILFLCTAAHSAPMLNGIAVHQELGQEVFIGALYSESLSNNADSLLNNNQPMRMELKIVAPEGLTTRRFSRLWIEGMAINNRADVLTAQADNMVKFDGLFKGRFMTNDHVVFDSIPGKGVNISVNGVLLGNIADNQFFSVLLTTWIGRVPLSSDFRDSLLKVGNIDGALRSRFDTIKPNSARIAEIHNWATPVVAEVKSSSSKAASSAPREVAAIEKPEVPALAAAVIEKPTIELPAVPPAPVTQVTTAAAASSAPAVAAAKPAPAPIASDDEDDEDEGPALTAQSLLARQFYVSDILKKVFSKTRYPSRALERGQEGSVRIAVVIDRQGNILSMNSLDESRHELLNREAREAIKRSAPFPEIPAALPGARFEFTVPIRFTLPKQ